MATENLTQDPPSGAETDADEQKFEVEVIDDTPAVDRNRKPAGKEPAEVTDEELEGYSAKVKSRIDELTRARHDERRRADTVQRERDEAIRVARALLQDREQMTKRMQTGEEALSRTLQNSATGAIEAARAKVKAAYESGDPEQIATATEALADAKFQGERAKNFRPAPLQDATAVVQTPTSQQNVAQNQQAPVDPKAKEWAGKNSWFGKDMEMTALAYGIDEDLRANGVDPTSDDYYAKLNSRIRQRFPEKFEQEGSGGQGTNSRPPATVVAPGTRTSAPRRVVITESAKRIAERMGVPLELYAKEVAKMEKQNGR